MDGEIRSNGWDVIVIGAGFYGIQAARTYLDIHPNAKLLVLEWDDVVGGTWGSKRMYDAFWTQAPVGMAEFSDRTMSPPPKADQYWGFFPAKYVTAYLESYVDNHVYNGKTLRERILFHTRIERVKKSAGNWIVFCEGATRTFSTEKLIDATGMTSLPSIPSIPGQAEFLGAAVHHKDFGQSMLLADPKTQHLAVLGGAKSAADVAYAAAKAGKTVSWILREEGSGPAAFFSPEGSGPYANSNETVQTRLLGAFLACPFGKPSVLSMFLHRTRVGRWLVRKLWEGMDRDLRGKADFNREEGRKRGFANLEPDTPIFWQNDSSGVNQRPDFYSTIAKHVHVYRQSVDHISTNALVLSPKASSKLQSPQTIYLDAIVYCTGWTTTNPLFSPSLAYSLGLPVPLSDQIQDAEIQWTKREKTWDATILSQFPILRHPPKHHSPAPRNTPWRLYKAMAPLSDAADHSLVFLGKLTVGNNFRLAEIQALWAVAYLDGKLPRADDLADETRQREQDVAHTIAWCRRRYLAKGQTGNWFYYDIVSYTDMLLEQLGLRSHRRKGWWGNLFGPCFARDLAGLVDEYRNLYGER